MKLLARLFRRASDFDPRIVRRHSKGLREQINTLVEENEQLRIDLAAIKEAVRVYIDTVKRWPGHFAGGDAIVKWGDDEREMRWALEAACKDPNTQRCGVCEQPLGAHDDAVCGHKKKLCTLEAGREGSDET